MSSGLVYCCSQRSSQTESQLSGWEESEGKLAGRGCLTYLQRWRINPISSLGVAPAERMRRKPTLSVLGHMQRQAHVLFVCACSGNGFCLLEYVSARMCVCKCFCECLSISFSLKLWTVARQLWQQLSTWPGGDGADSSSWLRFWYAAQVNADTPPGQSRNRLRAR